MFINDDFLLDTPQARTLFHEYAEGQPIIDYHSHLDPAAIVDNRQFSNIAQLWLDGDHYKWRAMRTNGIPERLCSGDALDREKYDAWAATVPRLLRNPLYHWTHLELRRPFGISGILFSPETADEVWKKTSSMLQSGGMGALDILKRMNVETVCTTDDPCDDLSAHRRHASSGDSVKLLPTFRPDKARAVHQGSAWRAWNRHPAWKSVIWPLSGKRSPPGMTFLPVTAASSRTTHLKRLTRKACPERKPPPCSPPLSGAVTSPPGMRSVSPTT